MRVRLLTALVCIWPMLFTHRTLYAYENECVEFLNGILPGLAYHHKQIVKVVDTDPIVLGWGVGDKLVVGLFLPHKMPKNMVATHMGTCEQESLTLDIYYIRVLLSEI